MRSPLARFLAVASAALLLVGCTAPGPDGTPSTAPVADSATAPAPGDAGTEEPSVEPVVPVMAFDGDCTQVLTDEDLAAIAPVTWTPTDLHGTDPAAAIAGTLSCRWDSSAGRGVSVDIVPISLVGEEALATPDIVSCPETDGPDLCVGELAVGDSWLIAGGGDEAALSAIIGRVGARLIGQHPVAAPLPTGSWELPDCEAIVEAVSDAGMPDAEAGVQNDSQPYGPLWNLFEADGRAGWCAAHQPDEDGIAITIYPGGAGEGRIPTGEDFEVDGADRGWITRSDPGLTTGVVDAGVNRLAFSTYGFVDAPDEVLSAILEALTQRSDL